MNSYCIKPQPNQFTLVCFIFISILIAVILRSDLSIIEMPALLVFSFFMLYSLVNPWLQLLSLILLFFAIEPAPQEIGVGEMLITLVMVSYVLSTYLKEWYQNNLQALHFILTANAVFFFLVLAAYFYAMAQGISKEEFFRGIAPFLILYLSIPISLTFKEAFAFRIKWILIVYCILSLLIIIHINSIFFIKAFYQPYWIDGQDIKIFNPDKLLLATLQGPFRDRITLLIQQATSELIPVSMVIFTLITLFHKNYYIKTVSFGGASLALIAILETYTRSMLFAPLSILGVIGIWMVLQYKMFFRDYLKIIFFLSITGITFMHFIHIDSVWFSRLSVFIATIHQDKPQKYSLPIQQVLDETIKQVTDDKKHEEHIGQAKQDDTFLSRINEYQVAYSYFLKKPLFGAGIGIKHEINFPLSNGQYLHKNVGYIHNWIFYWLMVGGIVGLIFYISVLILPIFYLARLPSDLYLIKFFTISTLLTLSVYALFFAVFRLLTFNLILATVWGALFYLWQNKNKIGEQKPCVG